jgi:hypothetical protein
MKTKNRQFLALSAVVALTLSIAVTSCKKDKDDSPKPLSATINGTAYDFSGVTADAGNGWIHIEGDLTKDSSYFIVSVPDTLKANTAYDFDDVSVTFYDHKKRVMYMDFAFDAHGTLKLSNYDQSGKKIAGSFSGVLYSWSNEKDSAVITNGQFNTTYK